ncbi:MAG: hypothetical protein KDK36_03980 [Leptospiraceae bacterium]|nr:hypothetical protein [Leptospiraceae bacterium]
MEIYKSVELVKSRCSSLFVISFNALDISANNMELSENTKKVFEKVLEDSKKFPIDRGEKRIIKNILQKPETRWINDAVWKLEELGVLLWSLNLHKEMPFIGKQFSADTFLLMKEIEKVDSFRPIEDVERYYKYLKNVNWRFHFDFFKSMNKTGEGESNEEIILRRVTELKEDGTMEEIIDGDFTFEGVSFPKLSFVKKDSIKRLTELRMEVFTCLTEDEEDDWEE